MIAFQRALKEKYRGTLLKFTFKLLFYLLLTDIVEPCSYLLHFFVDHCYVQLGSIIQWQWGWNRQLSTNVELLVVLNQIKGTLVPQFCYNNICSARKHYTMAMGME